MSGTLSSLSVSLGYGRTLTMEQLAKGWEGHIQRLIRESGEPENKGTWGAHDYFAALHLRRFIARGSAQLDEDLVLLVSARVLKTDAALQEWTEDDLPGLVARFADVTPEADEWWWRRIPRTGLVRQQLDAWQARSTR